jgi:hypothetical protein
MELRHCRPCWRYFEAFESGVRSRLRRDEMGYALVDFFYCLLFRRMRLMRICACAGMRHGMLAEMYMNGYGYGIKDEL